MATVALLMGSGSDLPTMDQAVAVLRQLGVSHEVRVLSAHRTPDELIAFVRAAETAGVQVFIAAAGGAAHLAGVIAAHTLRPVIGIPIQTSSLGGLDSLLSTVQMPGGVPVATMAIGEAGATNAALFAAEILALTDKAVSQKLVQYRVEQREKVRQRDQRVQTQTAAKEGQ